MLSGFYKAAAGMLQQQRSINVLSNNMINARTPGFRTERVTSTTFESELMRRIEDGNTGALGTTSSTTIIDNVTTNFDASYLENTDRALDFAINGNGFFNIQGEDKTFLTRNGSFDVDSEGYLILKGVGRVLGKNGALKVGSSNFKLEKDGTIYNADERKIGTLLITNPDTTKLEKYANGMYAVTDNQDNQILRDANVLQNSTERSNVDLNRELTLIMEAQRSFQACSTLLKEIDQVNQKTVNQIASL